MKLPPQSFTSCNSLAPEGAVALHGLAQRYGHD